MERPVCVKNKFTKSIADEVWTNKTNPDKKILFRCSISLRIPYFFWASVGLKTPRIFCLLKMAYNEYRTTMQSTIMVPTIIIILYVGGVSSDFIMTIVLTSNNNRRFSWRSNDFHTTLHWNNFTLGRCLPWQPVCDTGYPW